MDNVPTSSEGFDDNVPCPSPDIDDESSVITNSDNTLNVNQAKNQLSDSQTKSPEPRRYYIPHPKVPICCKGYSFKGINGLEGHSTWVASRAGVRMEILQSKNTTSPDQDIVNNFLHASNMVFGGVARVTLFNLGEIIDVRWMTAKQSDFNANNSGRLHKRHTFAFEVPTDKINRAIMEGKLVNTGIEGVSDCDRHFGYRKTFRWFDFRGSEERLVPESKYKTFEKPKSATKVKAGSAKVATGTRTGLKFTNPARVMKTQQPQALSATRSKVLNSLMMHDGASSRTVPQLQPQTMHGQQLHGMISAALQNGRNTIPGQRPRASTTPAGFHSAPAPMSQTFVPYNHTNTGYVSHPSLFVPPAPANNSLYGSGARVLNQPDGPPQRVMANGQTGQNGGFPFARQASHSFTPGPGFVPAAQYIQTHPRLSQYPNSPHPSPGFVPVAQNGGFPFPHQAP